MAFKGLVNIVKRKKILHCGIKHSLGGVVKIASACNNTWTIDDVTYEADYSEVTCKRCIRILEQADEDGKVNRCGR
ncbi:hypothetical protein [Sporomusa malonica]|uniref:Uncharacterized protein n=1 Tax=Sporomusa malonica TaxID=112901 RepID=A0A1W2AT07_9FIRM|nr:hypothetical protein [Sporomusa malonica]SMC63827.1 hypothetical protein SAMN04488500_10693 [Sporomusa malonica]